MKTIRLLVIAAVATLQIQTTFSQSWSLTGNAGTTNANFLGTTDNKKLKLRTNNLDRMTILANGDIGIGLTSPTEELHLKGTMQIDRTSIGGNTTPALILNGLVNNIVTVLKVDGIQKASYGYDVSTNDFVIATDDVGLRPDFIINRDFGYVGLGTKTPVTTLDVNGSANIRGDVTVTGTGGLGDIKFTYYQQSIEFPDPGTAGQNSPMITMTQNPTSNSRMVIAHSPAFDDWGLEYNDADDQFNFLGAGSNRLSIDLGDGNVAIGSSAPSDRFEVHGGESSFYGNIGVQTPATASYTIRCGSTQGALIGIGTAEYIQDAASSTLSTANDWVPTTDNLYSLGSSSNRWQDVWAVDGTINTSDATMKTNVRDMSYGLDAIMKLRPVSYQWKNDQSYTKLGMIAQEIQKVLPEVVRDWDYVIDEQTGKKIKVASAKLGVMYDDIIPVLIKGMQEQQVMIEKKDAVISVQQTEINELKNSIAEIKTALNAAGISNFSIEEKYSVPSLNKSMLYQNEPNPFSNETTIRFSIPTSAASALITITDLYGNQVKTVIVTPGMNEIKIHSGELSSGSYRYTLIVDGVKVDTKQLIIAR